MGAVYAYTCSVCGASFNMDDAGGGLRYEALGCDTHGQTSRAVPRLVGGVLADHRRPRFRLSRLGKRAKRRQPDSRRAVARHAAQNASPRDAWSYVLTDEPPG
jgi:hypothetical protein